MKRHINLLQPDLFEIQSEGRAFIKKALFPAVILVIVVILAGFYLQDQKKGSALFSEVESIRQQRDELRRQVETVSSRIQSAGRVISSRLDSVRTDRILKERISWSHILKEFSFIIPKGIWITELENVTGEGVRILGFAQSHKKVTEMMSSMETSRFFQDVSLEFSRQNPGERRFDFSIHSGVKREGPRGLEDG